MGTDVIGREEERRAVGRFLQRCERGPAALVVSGEPGIGKTVLWQAGVEAARDLGMVVLVCRAAEAEATLSFAALADLLEGRLEEALAAVEGTRRRALEAALLIGDPGPDAVDQRGIAFAFLDALRGLASSEPLVVAIDDVQWLDTSSARVLQFALRRLRDEPVGVLATVRAETDTPAPLGVDYLEWLALDPLSLGALHRLLHERLALDLTRPELSRLHEVTEGNPFYALELGRLLAHSHDRLPAGQPLPVPGSFRELLGERLARLPAGAREVLLSAATLARPTVEALETVHGPLTQKALERAVRAGVIELDGSRVRFSHPLFAAVCYQEAPIWTRRAAHRELAGVVGDTEERARHLALASDGPDPDAVAALESASEHAADRGATAAAAELAELSAELTPSGSPERRGLLLRAAGRHRVAGDRIRAGEILEELLLDARGDERADVLLALARTRRGPVPWSIALCEEAVEETDDASRVADTFAFLSFLRILDGDVYGALAAARAGLERAERVGDPELLARTIGRVASAEQFALEITPGLLERGIELERSLPRQLEYPESPVITFTRRLTLLGELTRARELMTREEELAMARGDEGTRAQLLFYLAMVEWHAGRWPEGLEHVDAALELAAQLGDGQYRGMVLYARATILAHLGQVEGVREIVGAASSLAETTGDATFRIWNESLLGFLELSVGDSRAAAAHLRPLPEALLAQGWNEPGDPWPETIEVLVALGELGEARRLLELFDGLVRRLDAPHGLAAAARCRGLLAAAEGDLAGAFASFDQALAEHGRSEYPFELGRTLLALGGVRRRARQKRAAREALEEAVEIFDGLGARLWAAQAQEELARIPGRRPKGDVLTEMETQVATLAAAGRSNKAIAQTLHVSVHTVEAHLTRAYRKLGVQSRAELARHPSFPGGAAAKV
ncbi:MAG TPA: AAA family ATPase [Gaiellaceae bacterium]|nr:AAA family ATPase [Gaiellaceae bacterium]